jgi:hypothetical protein
MYEKIALLGRVAAIKRAALDVPPRKSSHSKLFKVNNEETKQELGNALHQATRNVKSPHRYGRKVKSRFN